MAVGEHVERVSRPRGVSQTLLGMPGLCRRRVALPARKPVFRLSDYTARMVRPDGLGPAGGADPRCIRLAGESPAAVTAGGPRSRLRATGEIPACEWSVESPARGVCRVVGAQICGPSVKRTLQPRDRRTRKGESAEPLMPRRRQQTASRSGTMQDALGVGRPARRDSLVRNRRGPTRWPTSGRSDRYKPTVKCDQTGRESEGSIVLLTPGESPVEGRDPALVTPASGGKCEGMVARPNSPLTKHENPSAGFSCRPSAPGRDGCARSPFGPGRLTSCRWRDDDSRTGGVHAA